MTAQSARPAPAGPTVFVLSLFFPPTFGGAAARVGGQVEAMKMAGLRPVVVTSQPQYPSGRLPPGYKGAWLTRHREREADVWRVRLPVLPFSGLASRLVQFVYFCLASFFVSLSVRKFYDRVDSIYAVHPVIFIAAPGFALSKIFGTKFVLGVPDLWPEELFVMKGRAVGVLGRLARPLSRIAYSRAERLLTIGEGAAAYLVRSYGVARDRVTPLYGPVDTSFFSPVRKREARTRLRAEGVADIGADQFLAIYSGVLSPSYDFGILLEAARILQESDARWRVLLVGEGELGNQIASAITERGLRNVTMLPAQPRGVLPTLIGAADLCLAPLSNLAIYSIAMTSKLSEYLSCGRPILLSGPRGEASRLLESRECGFYCAPGDPPEFARIISDAGEEGGKLDDMGRRARALAEERFSTSSAAHVLGRVFAS